MKWSILEALATLKNGYENSTVRNEEAPVATGITMDDGDPK